MSIGPETLPREATIVFADLRGFSATAAAYPAEAMVQLLNRWFVAMSELIIGHGGTIDRFMGDSVMAVFFRAEGDDDVRRAIACAVEMQIVMDEINRHRAAGVPELFLGIGINSGTVAAGRLGSELYSVHTVIGDEVNLASRIESLSLRGQILVSEATAVLAGGYARTGQPMEVYVKGWRARLRVREVLGIPALGKQLPQRDARRSPRVPVLLPFSYELLADKIVSSVSATGTLLDIGYNGAQAEVAAELPLYSELKLGIELPLIGYRSHDIYARVVHIERNGARVVARMEFTSIDAEGKEQIERFVQEVMQRTQLPAPRRARRVGLGRWGKRPTRPGLLRECFLLLAVAAAFLQYYFLDVLVQIESLPQVVVFVTQDAPPTRVQGLIALIASWF
jgi:adenylate cyclase